MAPRTCLKMMTLATACLAVAGGCATRQKTAGEAMLDRSHEANVAVAQAPAPEPVPAPSPAPVPAPEVAAPAGSTGVAASDPAGLTKTGSGTMIISANSTPGADQAAIARGWSPVISRYQNGNVIAGPTYRILPPPAASNRDVDQKFVDFYATVLAVPQFFVTPVWMLFTPPLTEVQAHGEEFGPSYTVDDPIDTSREKSAGLIKLTRD